MKTTELIKILRRNEHGGATGRAREVMFCIGDKIINTDGIEVTGSGDGLFAELFLSLPDAEPKKGRWIDMDDHVMCSCCGAAHYGVDKNYCPNCGADMRIRTTDECNEIIREMFDHWDDFPDGMEADL